MTPSAGPAPWARGASIGLGVLLTVALVVLHVEFHRHAGPLWRDEVNSVNLARMPSLADVLANNHLDSFPVVWVTLLYTWRVGVGETDEALRWLGLLIGLATIAVVWWTERRLGLGPPLVTLVLFGMSPSTIVYGDSVRGYGLGALALAFSVGAVWVFVENPTLTAYLVAQVAALLAVQTYFPNAILLFAILTAAAAVCLRRRAWRTLAMAIGLGAVAAASLLINVPWIDYAFRVAALEQGEWSLWFRIDVFRQALASDVPLLSVLWAVASVLATIGCGLVWWSPGASAAPADKDRALFAAVAGTVGLLSYFGYLTYLAKLPTQFWYYLSLTALLALVCDVGIFLLACRVRAGQVVRLGAVGLAAMLVAGDAATSVRVRMTNLDVIADTLAREAKADDLIVVVPWYCGITFERYYRGRAPWITLPDFDEHRFHLHLLVAEKMQKGDAGIATELARIETTLRTGGRVWIVGAPHAPPAGQPAPSLPPAPTGPQGWRAAPYLDGWELQMGALLQAHGGDTFVTALPDAGRVNAWERLPLLLVQGWH